MAHEIHMDTDGILRVALIGEFDKGEVEFLQRGLAPFLEAATPSNPLHVILDAGRIGKLLMDARDYFTELNKDPRLGQMAVVHADAQMRVLSRFIPKASGRDNLRVFESDADALKWLREKMWVA